MVVRVISVIITTMLLLAITVGLCGFKKVMGKNYELRRKRKKVCLKALIIGITNISVCIKFQLTRLIVMLGSIFIFVNKDLFLGFLFMASR